MAVDTAARRLSMLDFCDIAIKPGIPAPDGTIDAGDRIHFLGLYSGLFDGGVGGSPLRNRVQAILHPGLLLTR